MKIQKNVLHSTKKKMVKTLKDLKVTKKRILLRVDYDVPLKGGKVEDDSRILASLPTIKQLQKRNVEKIIILCHIDRPGGKIVEELKVKPVWEKLRQLMENTAGIEIEENLRFNPGEEANDQAFAEQLANMGDAFVNDAFAVSHRSHASIVTLPKFLPSAIGLHFEKEIHALSKVMNNPRRPFIAIMGGAKLETKLPVIEKLANIADEILIGGKLAAEVKSACSPEALKKLIVAKLTPEGKDITEETIKIFEEKIEKAGTIVWNGPMGVFEEKETSRGTKEIARAINNASGYTVIGGGDTEAAATIFNAEDKLDHISMGGGAMLQYLTEGTLPGLQAIKEGVEHGKSSN